MHFGGSRFRGWGPDTGPCGSCSLGLFACCRKAWPAFFPLAAHWPYRRYTLIKNTGDLTNHFYDTCSQGHYALEQPFSGKPLVWNLTAELRFNLFHPKEGEVITRSASGNQERPFTQIAHQVPRVSLSTPPSADPATLKASSPRGDPRDGALEHIWRMPAKCPQEGLRRPILSIFAAWPPNVPRKASECPLDVHVGRSSQAYFLERNSAMDNSIGGS